MQFWTFPKAVARFGLKKKFQAIRVRIWAEDRGALIFDVLGGLVQAYSFSLAMAPRQFSLRSMSWSTQQSLAR